MNRENIIGNKIRLLRKSLGLTQEQLAEKANMDYKYLSKIENGLHLPSYKTIRKICDALQTNIDCFEIPSPIENSTTNDSYIKALKILNSAKNKREMDYYFKVLKLAQCGLRMN